MEDRKSWLTEENAEAHRADAQHVRMVVGVALLVVALVAVAGCEHQWPVESASVYKIEVSKSETIETQSQPLPNGDCKHGRTLPYIVYPGATGRHSATCHIRINPTLSVEYPCHAPDSGQNPPFLCTE